jgi:hypothetical protein
MAVQFLALTGTLALPSSAETFKREKLNLWRLSKLETSLLAQPNAEPPSCVPYRKAPPMTDISDEIMQRAYVLVGGAANPLADDVASALMEAEARGKAEAEKWKQAASDLQDLIATPIDIIEQRARAEGFAMAKEQAIKLADGRADTYAKLANENEGTALGESYTFRCGACAAMSDLIRAMEMSDE